MSTTSGGEWSAIVRSPLESKPTYRGGHAGLVEGGKHARVKRVSKPHRAGGLVQYPLEPWQGGGGGVTGGSAYRQSGGWCGIAGGWGHCGSNDWGRGLRRCLLVVQSGYDSPELGKFLLEFQNFCCGGVGLVGWGHGRRGWGLDRLGRLGPWGCEIWKEHKDNMAVCVWKDINTFHSEYQLSAPHLKTLAERLAAIKTKASTLVYKFSFLQGQRDDQGSKTFRNHELFKQIVPYMAILYVASYVRYLIKGVLDSYAAHSMMEDKISPAKNEEDFWKMHKKMQDVLDHSYHGPKLTATLKAWAQEAYTSELLDLPSDASLECEIDLD
ncbi:hypothetical protein L210DRAFT_3503961 [Boletus edulis BED1]|uniref:Uncharacterized protein n=1 Tax=Boletus edulis BED1 TaxID=1328754 RepID=A0AAD4BU45_BOLED|nr:hypothetical protein L210DRAFT_3503961 [Boletus edulis BED1]